MNDSHNCEERVRQLAKATSSALLQETRLKGTVAGHEAWPTRWKVVAASIQARPKNNKLEA